MCTIVAIKGLRADLPLVVAANRDEFYARAATPPQVVREAGPRAIAGVDRQSGGTWMGANDAGVFAAITNQRSYGAADRSLRSRGEIVMRALAQGDVGGIDRVLEDTDPRAYNAFNLMYGDARTLKVAYSRRARGAIEIVALDDGIWVLPNDRIGSPEFPKARRAHALTAPFVDAPWEELVGHLKAMLGDHALPPLDEVPTPPPEAPFTKPFVQRLQALCIHTETYGTRSSTLLALSERGVAHYLSGEGPACESALVDYTTLLG